MLHMVNKHLAWLKPGTGLNPTQQQISWKIFLCALSSWSRCL